MSEQLLARFEIPRGDALTVRCSMTLPAQGFRVAALFGPSGCGKTTILRCLAGLERPGSGSIRFRDADWFDSAKRIDQPPQRRRVGLLFQDYALFPHLSAAQNIGYALRSLPRAELDARVAELVARFHLRGLERRAPSRLSGGEQQRVALARALAPSPDLLLLDEPLSALDMPTRTELRRELRDLLAQAGVPVILVTHDAAEVRELADDALVMHRGEIIQSGPVAAVFADPADDTVRRILGLNPHTPATRSE